MCVQTFLNVNSYLKSFYPNVSYHIIHTVYIYITNIKYALYIKILIYFTVYMMYIYNMVFHNQDNVDIFKSLHTMIVYHYIPLYLGRHRKGRSCYGPFYF